MQRDAGGMLIGDLFREKAPAGCVLVHCGPAGLEEAGGRTLQVEGPGLETRHWNAQLQADGLSRTHNWTMSLFA